MRQLLAVLFTCFALFAIPALGAEIDVSRDWRFQLGDVANGAASEFDDSGWELVDAPHAARIEALVTDKEKNQQWEGVCWYRKDLILPDSARGQVVLLRFEGAMNKAQLFVNGEKRAESIDGYTPFVADLSDLADSAEPISLALRLDNRHDPAIGPKPLQTLDFHLYHGLYRTVFLRVLPKLHITDEILENKPASGGIFVTYPQVADKSAVVSTQVHVRNASTEPRSFTVATTLRSLSGAAVQTAHSPVVQLKAGEDQTVTVAMTVEQPKLWSPQAPNLYLLDADIRENDSAVDSRRERIGIRRFELGLGGLTINGRKHFLRGVNRHQEYPYVGNAVPANAQYRDALKIKQAGFDYVRLSHYPQSPAFMDACDELGLITMNAILGWQFNPGTPEFMQNRLRASRALVRRDRNHASAVFWELALNETRMSPDFIRDLNTVGEEEYPGDQMFTAGWVKGYDVKLTARQHHSTKEFMTADYPSLVSEYGDWEYYAQNAGLNQDKWGDLKEDERNSRQLRRHGEVRLLQQATNLQEAHNENRGTRAMGDGYWVMYDYNRGYAADLEASGVMDIFRLPKFSHYFYQSQRDATDIIPGVSGGPMVFAATWWTSASPLAVRIFSNCEEVELFLNGRSLGRQKPDQDKLSNNLPHPPFTFALQAFEAGELKAVGFISGQKAAEHIVRTPLKARRLELQPDLSNRPVSKGGDLIFVYARVLDDAGTVVPDGEVDVKFAVEGDAELVGHNPIRAEAGIATILLKTGYTGQPVKISASAADLSPAELKLTTIQ